jgi:hypothetical protein
MSYMGRSRLMTARPNLPALVIGSLLLTAAVVALFWVRVVDGDVLMHLRTGQWILAHRSIPRSDVFSANALGRPWTTHEWLWEVLAYGCWQVGQWKALYALRLVLVLGTLGFAMAAARVSGASAVAAIAAGLLTVGPLASFAEIRPQLASQCLFAVVMFAVGRMLLRARTARRASVVAWVGGLALIFVTWANLHGAVLLGFVVLGCGIVAAALSRSWSAVRLLAIAGVVCVGAAMVNPHVWELFLFPFKVVGQQSFRMQIYEWSRPDFTRPFWPFWVLVAVAVVLGTFGTYRTYRNYKTDKSDETDSTSYNRQCCGAVWLFQLVLPGLMGLAAVASRRQIPFFAIAAVGPCAAGVQALLARVRLPDAQRWLGAVAAVLVAALSVPFAFSCYAPAGRDVGMGLARDRFPEVAANRLANLHVAQASLLNDYNDGGFLIWRLAPEWPVTMDGRVDVYGPELVKKYEQVWSGAAGWQDVLREWHVEAILGRFEVSHALPKHNLYTELAGSPDWALVYWDDAGQLFLKRGTTLELSALKPYRMLAPGLSMQQNGARVKSQADWDILGADLRRSVSESPESRRAAAMLRAYESAGAVK